MDYISTLKPKLSFFVKTFICLWRHNLNSSKFHNVYSSLNHYTSFFLITFVFFKSFVQCWTCARSKKSCDLLNLQKYIKASKNLLQTLHSLSFLLKTLGQITCWPQLLSPPQVAIKLGHNK